MTLHAFYGCDTTSSLFNVGKTTCLKLYNKDKDFKEAISLFRLPNVPKEEIHRAGTHIMVATYKGKKGQDLKELRHDRYQERKKVSDFVHPRTLPPTPRGTCKHSEKEYFSVQEWRGNQLRPVHWSWELVDCHYQCMLT